MKLRYNADKIRNNQGIELIEFPVDTRMHIVNGRIDGNNGLCTKYDAQDSENQDGITPSIQKVEALVQWTM